MNIIKKVTTGLLAAMALSWAQTAWAADNGTEFGIADDLSVYGATGTWVDPDVEIKGFSVFGDTSGPNNIAAAPGNVAIRGDLQVDATSYFGSSVTIAGQAVIGSSLNVAGYGVFLSTVQMVNGNLRYGTSATPGQVLKADSNGFVTWGEDYSGASGGTPYYVPMWNNLGNAFVKSPFVGNSDNPTNLTMVSGSSLTINGAFEATGAVKLGNSTPSLGDVTIIGAATVGAGLGVTGSATVGGTLGVTGAATLSDNLSVSSNTQLGSNIGNRTGINHAPEDGVALAVHGDVNSGNYMVKFYSGSDNTNLAAWIKKK